VLIAQVVFLLECGHRDTERQSHRCQLSAYPHTGTCWCGW